MQKEMRYPAQETAEKHDRIVEEASRLFRERGFENVTVGEVMKAAGLTHGAFYAHFKSKEDLQAAAVAYGQGISLGSVQRAYGKKGGEAAYAGSYLSPKHRDNPGDGCTMATLAQEISRSTPEAREALEKGLQDILSAMGGDRKDAIYRSAAMIGAVVLARAVQNKPFSDEILRSVHERLD